MFKNFNIKDAKVILDSGQNGMIFIGIIVAFFLIVLFTTFVSLPFWAYVLLFAILGAPLLYFYGKMHENDEDKLD